MTTHRRAVKIEGTGNEHEDRCIGGGNLHRAGGLLVTGTGVCRALRENGHRAILVDLFLGLEEVPADLETLFDAPDGLCPDAKIEVEAPDLETVKRGRKDQGPSHIGPPRAGHLPEGGPGVPGPPRYGRGGRPHPGRPGFTGRALHRRGSSGLRCRHGQGGFKQILDVRHPPPPKWRLLSYGLDEAEPLAQTLPMPCVIKTIGGGSSLGVYLPEGPDGAEAGPGGGAALRRQASWRRSGSTAGS